MLYSARGILTAKNLPKKWKCDKKARFEGKKLVCLYSKFPYLCRLKLSRYFKSKKYGKNFKESAGNAGFRDVSHDRIGT